jgi:hypothetical protein
VRRHVIDHRVTFHVPLASQGYTVTIVDRSDDV